MKTFKELGLSREFVKVLEKANITTPSEIQEKTIPLVLAGKDVIGGSATGSGKTLAFASGIIENFKKNGTVQALILTPTRELAEQVSNSIRDFSKYKDLHIFPVYGGVNIETQIRFLRNTDIVVGTPGRILDHLHRKTLDLSNIKYLILDEVDRMFDMGFQVDVQKILKECPEKRQTMLFSATISSDVNYLAQKYTNNPTEVSVESHVDPSKLKQIYYDIPDGLKFSLFYHLIKREKAKLVMVFCATRRNVDFVANNLNNLGIKAKAIHGGMLQNKRNKVLEEFNSKNGINVLVCTDVAARGLDIKRVSHVYNYDLPKTSDEYIHRIGRTARAGKEGIAINILSSRDYENFNNIQMDEKLKIKEVRPPLVDKVGIITEERKPRRSFENRRNNSARGPFRGRPRQNSRGGKHFSRGGGDNSRRGNTQRRGNRNGNNRKPSFGKRINNDINRKSFSRPKRKNFQGRRNSYYSKN